MARIVWKTDTIQEVRKNAHFKPKTAVEQNKQICRKSYIYTTNSNFSYRCKAVSDNCMICICNSNNLFYIWGLDKTENPNEYYSILLCCYRHILTRKITPIIEPMGYCQQSKTMQKIEKQQNVSFLRWKQNISFLFYWWNKTCHFLSADETKCGKNMIEKMKFRR